MKTFRNIFQEVKTLVNTIKVMELKFYKDPTKENREQLHKVQAKLSRYLHFEKQFRK